MPHGDQTVSWISFKQVPARPQGAENEACLPNPRASSILDAAAIEPHAWRGMAHEILERNVQHPRQLSPWWASAPAVSRWPSGWRDKLEPDRRTQAPAIGMLDINLYRDDLSLIAGSSGPASSTEIPFDLDGIRGRAGGRRPVHGTHRARGARTA